MCTTKAAFFDRDGTLIEDVGYLTSVDQVKIITSIIPVCKAFQAAGYKLFIVTNQSGVARGFFDEVAVNEVNNYLQKLFSTHFIFFEKCFYCPHHPKEGSDLRYTRKCECRKPKPGMLLQAAHEYNLNLQDSVMIGDKECDFQVGVAVGCKSFFVQDIVNDTLSWLQHNKDLIHKNVL